MDEHRLQVELGHASSPSADVTSGEGSRIGQGMVFEGQFFTGQALEVHGIARGTLAQLPGHTAEVILQPGSDVQAQIRAHTVDLGGKLTGRVENPSGLTVLRHTGSVKGEIRYHQIQLEGGVVVASLARLEAVNT